MSQPNQIRIQTTVVKSTNQSNSRRKKQTKFTFNLVKSTNQSTSRRIWTLYKPAIQPINQTNYNLSTNQRPNYKQTRNTASRITQSKTTEENHRTNKNQTKVALKPTKPRNQSNIAVKPTNPPNNQNQALSLLARWNSRTATRDVRQSARKTKPEQIYCCQACM